MDGSVGLHGAATLIIPEQHWVRQHCCLQSQVVASSSTCTCIHLQCMFYEVVVHHMYTGQPMLALVRMNNLRALHLYISM